MRTARISPLVPRLRVTKVSYDKQEKCARLDGISVTPVLATARSGSLVAKIWRNSIAAAAVVIVMSDRW
jgi:hypothetical protein